MIKKSVKFILLLSIILFLVSAVNAHETTNDVQITSQDSLNTKSAELYQDQAISTSSNQNTIKNTTNTKVNHNTKTTKSNTLTKNTKKSSTKSSSQKVIYVSKTGKDSNIGTKSKPKKTIKNAILKLKNKGVIYILAGTYNEYHLKITKSMTIIGAGRVNTIINANKKGRIFSISPKKTVSIKNITLTNGKINNANGGSIFAKKANLSLYNVKISNSIATASNPKKGCAGAIMAHSGKLTIIKSVIVNSSSLSNGGAICAWNIIFTMSKSVLSNNHALDDAYGVGGAIAVDKQSIVTISSSNFIKNTASYGGAISLFRSKSDLKMNTCSFIKNSANVGNVFYKGSTAKTSKVNLKYNWWNTLKPNWSKLIKDYNKKYKHPKEWIMMKFTSNKNYVLVSANKASYSTLTANFNYYRTFKSSKIKYHHNSKPIWNLNVSYSFSDNTVLSKKTVNSVSKITYKHISKVTNTVSVFVKIYGKIISSLKLKYSVI